MGEKLYRIGGIRNPHVILTIDCSLQDCLNCELGNCPDMWETSITGENSLAIKRANAGYNLIPEDLANDCQCTFHEVAVSSDYQERYFNIPDAEACHQKCLEHAECQLFTWASPEVKFDNRYKCFLRWGNLNNVHAAPGYLSNYRNCWKKIEVSQPQPKN